MRPYFASLASAIPSLCPVQCFSLSIIKSHLLIFHNCQIFFKLFLTILYTLYFYLTIEKLTIPAEKNTPAIFSFSAGNQLVIKRGGVWGGGKRKKCLPAKGRSYPLAENSSFFFLTPFPFSIQFQCLNNSIFNFFFGRPR